jgi:bifunctional isochorismate lyase/aryl carrier protein
MQEYFLNFWGENSAMMEQVVANIAACALLQSAQYSGVLHRAAERAER